MKTILIILICTVMLIGQSPNENNAEELSSGAAFGLSMLHFTIPLGFIYATGAEGLAPIFLLTYSFAGSSAAGYLYLGKSKEYLEKTAIRSFIVGGVYYAGLNSHDREWGNLPGVLYATAVNLGICIYTYIIDYIEIGEIVEKHNQKLSFNMTPMISPLTKASGLQFSLNF